MKKIILLFFVVTCSLFANVEFYNKYDDIFKKYEKEFGISYFLMKSIALTENDKFDPNAVMYNTNGTRDIGIMQINTSWAKWMPEAGITVEKLKDPDFNIKVSFMIVDKIIQTYGYNWSSIGRYHSGTPIHKNKWLARIKSNILYLASIDERITIDKTKQTQASNF